MPALQVKAVDYDFLTPLPPRARGGLTERVACALRKAIIDAELPPGAFIDKLEVCDRLGVSRFPVSEALARLEQEGLVDILPQRGTRVARIRMTEVRQSTFIRRALEAETVRKIAPTIGDAALAALEANIVHQRSAAEGQDLRRFYELDVEFHHLLQNALDLPRVRSAVEHARAGLERVRRLLASKQRLALTLAEHEAIYAALRGHDADAAGLAMETHLDAVVTELLALAPTNMSLFDDL